jgi:hypothetical protein
MAARARKGHTERMSSQHLTPTQETLMEARALYQSLMLHGATSRTTPASRAFLAQQLANVSAIDCELPQAFADLEDWMLRGNADVAGRYAEYLARRRLGAPRHFFSNRAHALYFLRAVAPTKLVDGAWLYGLTRQWKNPRHADLIRTYLEELGDGDESKNHVLLYRKLLAANGLEQWQDLPSAFFTQGAIQLALGYNADAFIPETLGFNLGYEQLPLHLLITAYELDELGIDPYYFTLHVTVDNAGSGHARRAVNAVLESIPEFGDKEAFWQRVRSGYNLNELGLGTSAVIKIFDIEREAVEIFQRKSIAGHGAHSDYCKVAGRTINDWLSDPAQVPYFLDALQRAGWITLGTPPQDNRFWQLLQGERAKMFGVFNGYELQVIHDWIRGPASADGQAYDWMAPADEPQAQYRARSHRAIEKMLDRAAGPTGSVSTAEVLDEDLRQLKLAVAAANDRSEAADLLARAMSPRQHWRPSGLHATRLFAQYALAA